MVKLIKHQELVDRIKRINSPVAKFILDLEYVDQKEKDYVNYLGVSRSNPMFISYLDKTREARNKIETVTKTTFFGDNCRIKFRRRGFKKYFWRGKYLHNKLNWDGTSAPIESNLPFFRWGSTLYGYNHNSSAQTTPFDLFTNKFLKQEFKFKAADQFRNCSSWEEYKKLAASRVASYIGNVEWDNQYGNESSITNMSLAHIAYIKPQVNITRTNDLWTVSKRLHASAGKVVKKILGQRNAKLFNDKEIEDFVVQYKYQGCRELTGDSEFLYEEMEGDRIKWAYDESNYHSNAGSLGNSCMKSYYAQNFFDIYTKNTKHVSIAVLLKNERVAARAILWYPDTKRENLRYYDRIYYINDKARMVLSKHLQSLGYLDCYETRPKIKMELDFGYDEIRFFPYVDSMCYIKDKFLHSYRIADDHVLQCTGGGPKRNYKDAAESNCAHCGSLEYNEDMHLQVSGRYNGQRLCRVCTVHVPDRMRHYFKDEAVVDYYRKEMIHIDDAVEMDGKHYHMNDMRTLEDGSRYHISYLIRDVEGNFYREEDIKNHCILYRYEYYPFNHPNLVLIENNTYYHRDDNRIIQIDGRYILKTSDEFKKLVEEDPERYGEYRPARRGATVGSTSGIFFTVNRAPSWRAYRDSWGTPSEEPDER